MKETADCFYYFKKDEIIVKHSKNIIDLIEVGDYVNGYYIDEIQKIGKKRYLRCEADMLDNEIREDDIETIVTKEQFAKAEYKIEKGE